MTDPIFGITYCADSVGFPELSKEVKSTCDFSELHNAWVFANASIDKRKIFIVAGLVDPRDIDDSIKAKEAKTEYLEPGFGAACWMSGSKCNCVDVSAFLEKESSKKDSLSIIKTRQFFSEVFRSYEHSFGAIIFKRALRELGTNAIEPPLLKEMVVKYLAEQQLK